MAEGEVTMDKALVQRAISATCAICFIPVPVEQYLQDKERDAGRGREHWASR